MLVGALFSILASPFPKTKCDNACKLNTEEKHHLTDFIQPCKAKNGKTSSHHSIYYVINIQRQSAINLFMLSETNGIRHVKSHFKNPGHFQTKKKKIMLIIS